MDNGIMSVGNYIAAGADIGSPCESDFARTDILYAKSAWA
jgi:hypothetical protein